jgi:hypothetical protein
MLHQAGSQAIESALHRALGSWSPPTRASSAGSWPEPCERTTRGPGQGYLNIYDYTAQLIQPRETSRLSPMLNGMRQDHSWTWPGQHYVNIYDHIRHE